MVKKVVVVGGGLVGTAVARALRLRGVDVVVCERGVPGAEASWAAGGILSPQAECDVDGPMLRLCLDGLAGTLELCAALGDVGLRKTGTLDVATNASELLALQARVAWQQAAGLSAEWLEPDEVKARFRLAAGVGAAFFAGEAALEPRRFFEVLRGSAHSLGVKSVTGRRVVAVEPTRVILDEGTLQADAVVVCAGAWTAQVEGCGIDPAMIFPVRGQMVELQGEQASFDVVVYGHGGYAVPRLDGRVVVGSTMEHAGFTKAVTVGGLQKVLHTATSLVPALAEAPVLSTWAGLRPATRDGLPLLGKSKTDVWVASGHFRNGVLLAAVSGERLAAAIVDDVAIDRAFLPSR
ncbi:MAG: glycine oxidase ThiO [Deltaproteobacteria bacterium]|nr:glycine oxidase ThiO [Deltaproteobacteria bacterium]